MDTARAPRKQSAIPSPLAANRRTGVERTVVPGARAAMQKVGGPTVRLSTDKEPDAKTPLPEKDAKTVAGAGPGQPLPPEVKKTLEKNFGASLDKVRVHTDTNASTSAQGIAARAFTYGNHIYLGPGEQPTDLRLMAHEVAHVVQQQAAPMVQRSAVGQTDHYEAEADRASTAALRQESFKVQERTSGFRVQKLGLKDALNYFADKANIIPGFRMFTIVLGVNPINMSSVDRSAANIMRAVIEFIPGGGLITQALDNYGIFDKVGGWVDQQIRSLGMVGSSIKQAVTEFLDSLSWTDIFDLGGVWDRAKRIFTEPIDRIISFAGGLVTGIITFIKDAILMPLASLAEGTRGWDLLIAVLGKNPITGEAVPRTAETLIPGFLKLIGQEEVWQNMQKANALSRAWAWFQSALSGLMGFVQQIPTLAVNAFKSLELVDIVLLPRAFAKVGAVFGNFIGDFISWAGNAVWNLLEIIFDVVSPGALGYIKKTGAALKSIFKNPLPFVGNLVKAAKAGFQNFASNIGEHFKAGLLDWLTGSLPGVYIPKSFSLGELVKFVFSVLGLTWQNVRVKLVKVLGEPVVKAMEVGFDIVVTLVTQGPAAAWDKIKDQLANLQDMVVNGIIDMVVDIVTKKAIPKLIAMFIPGAGFISAILSIYDTVMVFVNKISKIIQVVTGFINSIVAIASGDISSAAKRVESTLAGLLSLAINFLAGFAGLGKVADKVMGVINKVRAKIDKALDALINWIVTMAKKLFSGKASPEGPDTRSPEEKRLALHQAILEAQGVARRRGTTRETLERALPEIAKRFRLKSLRTADHGEESYRIHGELNPEEDSSDLPKVLTVERAIAKIQSDLRARKERIEISVATVEQARAVIAQAFPAAPEMPSPTAGSPYQSQVDIKNRAAFLQFTERAVAYHVDVRPYRVGEIRTRLQQEIREVTERRDRARTELLYHRDNPAWSARHQDNMRESERNLEAANTSLRNLQEINANLSSHEAEWRKLEKEGVLYGHQTVEGSSHRTNPHVNVEGPTQVTTRTETFDLFIKLAIYVRRA